MSTPCMIRLFNSGVALYKHEDGDANSMLPLIDRAFQQHGKHIRLDENRLPNGHGAMRLTEAIIFVAGDVLQETQFCLSPDTKPFMTGVLWLYWVTVEKNKPVVYYKEVNWKKQPTWPTRKSLKHIVPDLEPVDENPLQPAIDKAILYDLQDRKTMVTKRFKKSPTRQQLMDRHFEKTDVPQE